MMAKAIAAECGSNFLNITPSVIYDMYVGEGEKNAKV
jgi:SpoVK/Ycf46/Vps4 family AAA+-type ATPase